MIVSVDVVLHDLAIGGREHPGERPEPGAVALVELRDTSQADAAAVTLARQRAEVTGASGRWLATAELVVHEPVDPRTDLTAWVRVTGSPDAPLASGDWITMQSVPVDPKAEEQRVEAPVRRVG